MDCGDAWTATDGATLPVMDLRAAEIGSSWLLAGWGAAVPLLVAALRHADWERVTRGAQRWFWHGAIAALIALWSLKATLVSGFSFHLLGAAFLALTLGWPLALLGGLIVVVVSGILSSAHWANLPLVWLTLVVLPVTVSHTALRLSQRFLPPNFFVYTFLVAFFGTWLSVLVSVSVATVLWVLAVEHIGAGELLTYLPITIQLGFGEASLTGMLVTIGVVYRPAWVATFDDARYLRASARPSRGPDGNES